MTFNKRTRKKRNITHTHISAEKDIDNENNKGMLYQTFQLRHTRTSRICYDEEKQNKENLVKILQNSTQLTSESKSFIEHFTRKR